MSAGGYALYSIRPQLLTFCSFPHPDHETSYCVSQNMETINDIFILQTVRLLGPEWRSQPEIFIVWWIHSKRHPAGMADVNSSCQSTVWSTSIAAFSCGRRGKSGFFPVNSNPYVRVSRPVWVVHNSHIKEEPRDVQWREIVRDTNERQLFRK